MQKKKAYSSYAVVIGLVCLSFTSLFVPLSVDHVSAVWVLNPAPDNALMVGDGWAYPTIQDALRVATEGDTIYVNTGEYYSNVGSNNLLIEESGITLMGAYASDTIIYGDNSGNIIEIRASNVVITGFTLSCEIGVYDYNNAAVAVFSSNAIISENIFSNSGYHGIFLHREVQNTTMSSNHFIDTKYAISLYQSSNNIIRNNIIEETDEGVCKVGINFLNQSRSNLILDNNISTMDTGLAFREDSSSNTVTGNTIQYCRASGIGFGRWITHTLVTGNIIIDNARGVQFSPYLSDDEKPINNTLYHNDFVNNGGLNGTSSPDQAYDPYGNIWYKSYPDGGNYWQDDVFQIIDEQCGDSQIEPCHEGDGIVDFPYRINPHDAIVFDKYPLTSGMMTYYVEPIPDPEIVWVDDGFNRSMNSWSYEYFDNIQNAINRVAEGGFVNVYPGTYDENIIISKTVSVTSVDGPEDTIIDGQDSPYVIIITGDSVILSNFTIITTQTGIDIQSDNNKISDNSIVGGLYGIYLRSSSGNSITRNTLSTTTVGDSQGISVTSSSDWNVIKYNTIFGFTNSGILIANSDNNEINFCTIYDIQSTDYGYGIRLTNQSRENSVKGNNLRENRIGVIIDTNSFENILFHNNFFENNLHAQDEGENMWSTGGEGNFWDDYEDKYPDAREINGTGIWDTPYLIFSASQSSVYDFFPIMNQTGWNHPPYIPSNPIPASNSTGIPIDTFLQWDGGDPDEGDTVEYMVSLSLVSPPGAPSLFREGRIYTIGYFLEYDTTYYWRITAKDSYHEQTDGPIWSFTTEAESEEGPEITPITPLPDSIIYDTTPLIAAEYYDPDAIDINSIEFFIDGENVTSNISITQSNIEYQPISNLSFDEHRVILYVSDMLGHRSAAEWFFTIDHSSVIIDEVVGNISEGNSTEIMLNSEDTGIVSIYFTPSEYLRNVKISVTKLRGRPNNIFEDPADHIYRYLDMKMTADDEYIADDDIKPVEIKLKVQQSWITENNIDQSTISLVRYFNDVWYHLPTEQYIDDESDVYFSALTSGFSTFAVVGSQVVEVQPYETGTSIPWMVIIGMIIAATVILLIFLFKAGYIYTDESSSGDSQKKLSDKSKKKK